MLGLDHLWGRQLIGDVVLYMNLFVSSSGDGIGSNRVFNKSILEGG